MNRIPLFRAHKPIILLSRLLKLIYLFATLMTHLGFLQPGGVWQIGSAQGKKFTWSNWEWKLRIRPTQALGWTQLWKLVKTADDDSGGRIKQMLHLAVASHLLCQPAMNTKSSGVINTLEGRVKKKKLPTNNAEIAFYPEQSYLPHWTLTDNCTLLFEAQKYDKMYTYRHRVVTKSFLINTY